MSQMISQAGEEGGGEQKAVQSNIKKDERFDVRWEGMPFKHRKIGRGPKATYEKVCIMPLWLRNLWPTSEFDPCAVWEQAKEEEAEEEVVREKAAAAEAAASKGSKGGGSKAKKGGGGGGKLSKKETIQAEQAKKRAEETIERDLEKLGNVLKMRERSMLYSMKLETKLGRLNQMLEILADSLKANDPKTAFDVLWEIESFPLFLQAVAEEVARDADAGGAGDEKEKKKSSKEKKKSKDKDEKKSKKSAPRSAPTQLVYDFKKTLKAARKLRDSEDMTEYQLVEMHDRLPPLSRFTTGWKLDEWQKRVLRQVDKKNSAIVCAPTSSGKTIISTYVTVAAGASGKILFVVPTEPLVWQVAALFNKLLRGQVAICMDQIYYRPDIELRTIVGTPMALETALTKLRGAVGDEVVGKLDYTQMKGGFDFDYAVYDEVHSLDSEEGDALQRLIRAVNCNFLALSATIGNAQQLKDWWTEVQGEQARDLEVIEAPAGAGEGRRGFVPPSGEVYLEEHSGRFINLQRYVWMGSTFVNLHPCSAMSVELLQSGRTEEVSLSFTPHDTYKLWEAFLEFYPEEAVKDLEPAGFFAKYETNRISLQQAKDYEEVLVKRLEKLSTDNPKETGDLLQRFNPGTVGPDVSIYDAVIDMKDKGLCPVIAFHLDTFMALSLFKELLKDVEVQQRNKYPNWAEEQRKKAAELARVRAIREKKMDRNKKEAEEEEKEGDDETSGFVDVTAPHPEFVLSPPNARVSSREFEDICEDLAPPNGKGELKNPQHPFLRALRRGFGIYIDDASFSRYRRVVQRLAQQGKLSVVFSDESLAYGVNMPFRSCCFCGSMDGLLNPLVAQQMSGRAGRRGLDTQGNLLYMNMAWPKIQGLMLGDIPAIVGQDPQYPTIALHHALSAETPGGMNFVDAQMGRRMASRTLQEFNENILPDEHYTETSQGIMRQLGFLDGDNDLKAPRMLLVAVWELRMFLPESLMLAHLMDTFMAHFVTGRHPDHAENIGVQVEFMGLLAMVVDRVPCKPGDTPLREVNYFTKNPERAARMESWSGIIKDFQDGLTGMPEEDKMRLPVVPVGEPLDSSIFQVISANSFKPIEPVSSFDKFRLMRRLRKIGGILMTLHNVLMMEAPYDLLEKLFRKCCVRVKYIIADQLAVEAKQEDESEYEGGGGASYNGGEGEAAAAPAAAAGAAAAAAAGGGVAETKGSS
ncbi:unnamed protein product [Ectocarpus sp. 6 AP-2014]